MKKEVEILKVMAAGPALAKNNDNAFEDIPDELKTAEMCLKAVKKDAYTFFYVPENFITEEMCFRAVKKGISMLQHIPEKFKSKELCLEAVKYSSDALNYVPDELKTPELCLKAVKYSGDALNYVPDELKTPELCLKAVKGSGGALNHVPDELKTAEMCLKAVKKDAYAFFHVPENFLTAEMCFRVVKKGGNMLQHIPEKFKSKELCLEAVKGSGYALNYVPDELKTAEMCRLALKNDGSILILYVPDKLKTAEMCLKAVKGSGDALEYVPDELKTAEMCLLAVKNDGSILYVPDKLKTAEMCLEAVKYSGDALKYVPDELKTAEMCLQAVKNDGSMLEYVPDKLKTAEMCLEAVKNNKNWPNWRFVSLLQYVPDDLKTTELYFETVKSKAQELQNVPENFMSTEMCLHAVKQDRRLFWHVPEKLKTMELCLEVLNGCGWIFNELLNKSLESPKTAETLNRLSSRLPVRPLGFIHRVDAARLLSIVRQEQPQTIALVLSCLEPYKASYLLQSLPDTLQMDVFCLIAAMDKAEIPPEIEQTLEKKISALSAEGGANAGAMETFAVIFDLASRATEEQLLQALEDEDAELAGEFRKRMLAFEDIVILSNEHIQRVLREVDFTELAKALKGADTLVQDAIFRNMSKRASSMIKEDMEYMGPIRLKNVNEARKKIVWIIRHLENSGEIAIDYTGKLERVPEKEASAVPPAESGASADRVMETIIEIIEGLDPILERQFIKSLEDKKPELAQEIRKRMFAFEDIVILSDRDVQKVMRELDSQNLAKALKGADTLVQDKIFINMSKRASSMIKEDMKYMGEISPQDIEEARGEIILIIRQLKHSGEITIPRNSEDELIY